ncbi:MAG: hypothetical protein KZQ82_06455 [Candidatus Thiodiazotropha sp. (ex Lucinoma annulata)]|nr:hypothetical protein [Candidatus Thiodiazotropha sp. (ex Lucinoma annulata)]
MRLLALVIFSVILSGCFHNATRVTGDPQKSITLEEAFRSVGASMRALEEAKGDKMLGIATSEIIVTFSISSKATDTSKLEANAGTSSKNTKTNESTSTNGSKDTSSSSAENTSSSSSGTSTEADGSKSSASNTAASKDESSTTSEKSSSDTNTTKTTTEIGSSASLKAEIGSTIEGNRSNVITVKLQSLPVLLSGLDKEKIELLKHIGYFKKDQIKAAGDNNVFYMLPDGLAQPGARSSKPILFSVPKTMDIIKRQEILDSLRKGADEK